jgi:hypothetical protein
VDEEEGDDDGPNQSMDGEKSADEMIAAAKYEIEYRRTAIEEGK